MTDEPKPRGDEQPIPDDEPKPPGDEQPIPDDEPKPPGDEQPIPDDEPKPPGDEQPIPDDELMSAYENWLAHGKEYGRPRLELRLMTAPTTDTSRALRELHQAETALRTEFPESPDEVTELASAWLSDIKGRRERTRSRNHFAIVVFSLVASIGAGVWAFGIASDPEEALLAWTGVGIMLLALVATTAFRVRSSIYTLSLRSGAGLFGPALVGLIAGLLVWVGKRASDLAVVTAMVVIVLSGVGLAAVVWLGVRWGAGRPWREVWLAASPSTREGQQPSDPVVNWLRKFGGEVGAYGRDQKRRARNWKLTHYILGGSAAALSAAAGVVAAQGEKLGDWVTGLALAAATVTAIVTLLNPGETSEAAQTSAVAAEALAREIDVMCDLDSDRWRRKINRDALEDVIGRFETIIGVPERSSFRARHEDTVSKMEHDLKDTTDSEAEPESDESDAEPASDSTGPPAIDPPGPAGEPSDV